MRDSIKPVMKIGRTNAAVANQGYTYNEAGFTYNEAIQYGGLYEHDIIKMNISVRNVIPSIKFARDFSTIISVAPSATDHTLIGILGLTY